MKDFQELWNEYIERYNITSSDYVCAAADSLDRAGCDEYVVINDHTGRVTMVDITQDWENLKSGILLSDDGTAIVGFKDSEDEVSVMVGETAEAFLQDAIVDADDLAAMAVASRDWTDPCGKEVC